MWNTLITVPRSPPICRVHTQRQQRLHCTSTAPMNSWTRLTHTSFHLCEHGYWHGYLDLHKAGPFSQSSDSGWGGRERRLLQDTWNREIRSRREGKEGGSGPVKNTLRALWSTTVPWNGCALQLNDIIHLKVEGRKKVQLTVYVWGWRFELKQSNSRHYLVVILACGNRFQKCVIIKFTWQLDSSLIAVLIKRVKTRPWLKNDEKQRF